MVQQWPLRNVILTLGLQLAYTSACGALCAWLLLHTGTILPAVAAHAVANWLGVPPLARMLVVSRTWAVPTIIGMVAFVAGIFVLQGAPCQGPFCHTIPQQS
jgi:hypothetical protein